MTTEEELSSGFVVQRFKSATLGPRVVLIDAGRERWQELAPHEALEIAEALVRAVRRQG